MTFPSIRKSLNTAGVSVSLQEKGEGESSNHYHDFIPAKGLFRWLKIASICTNDHEDHIQDTNLQTVETKSKRLCHTTAIDTRIVG